MKPTPKGWPRVSSSIYYCDAGKMIDWLCEAFEFQVKLKVEGDNGRIEHSELMYGEGMIMVGEERFGAASRWGVDLKSPLSLAGANTQGLMLYVDDVSTRIAPTPARQVLRSLMSLQCTITARIIGPIKVTAPSIPRDISGGSLNAFVINTGNITDGNNETVRRG